MALLKGKPKPEKKTPPKQRAPRKSGGKGRRIAFTVLVTLAVLALAFFLVVRDSERTSIAENAVGSIFSPINNAISSATGYVRDLANGVRDYFVMSQELALARQESEALKLRMTVLEEEERENVRLRDLLGVKEAQTDVTPIYGRVIARSTGVWMDTFTINCGETQGIRVNMPVVTGDGLVGRVFEVGANYAKVMSVIDTRSAIGCMIERTRDVGSMKGKISSTSTTAECHMYYLPAVNDIVPGDVVLTSGMDGMLPKGLVVGTVASVSRQSDLADQYIVVLPAVDFLHVEEVMVLPVVAQNEDSHAVLPTPTPRPTPVPTPTPLPSDESAMPTDPDEQIYVLPTPGFMGYGDEPTEEAPPEADPTPMPTYDPDTQPPEDRWLLGG